MFPKSFVFGAATAATQIEGGCTTSDWHAFAHAAGNETPDVACDSWNRWHEDFSLLKELGLSGYRMSIEWARIEPRPGEVDMMALTRYRRMLSELRRLGIEPMITLHHFSLPAWLQGGVLSPEFVSRFESLVRLAVGSLGDLCDLWITINEPTVLVAMGYLHGKWPPGEHRGFVNAARAQRQLLMAHTTAFQVIKSIQTHSRVGVAHHVRGIAPPRNPFDFLAAKFLGLGDMFANAVCRAGTQDFFGMNYYTRDAVRSSQRTLPKSDLGWEIDPKGFGILLRRWAARSKVPVMITENGIADAADTRRSSFIVDHLNEVESAIRDGVDVRGYYHWSLLDNFEWAHGYWPRFGLVEVDYATQTRRIRDSARVYLRIVQTRATTRGLLTRKSTGAPFGIGPDSK